MDWAGAHHEVDLFKKYGFLVSLCFSFFVPQTGSFLEMPCFVVILKKCEVENDADGIKTYFPTVLGIVFFNFHQIFFVGMGV